MISASVMSSARTGTGRDDWQTPECVLERVRKVGAIGIDPCTGDDNPVQAPTFYTGGVDDDGLVETWVHPLAGALAFANWPYSKSAQWAEKAAQEAALGASIIVLCAARPDTRWWARMWNAADVVAFWRGRLTFVGAPHPAPFPSALFGLNVGVRRFRAAFEDACHVVVP